MNSITVSITDLTILPDIPATLDSVSSPCREADATAAMGRTERPPFIGNDLADETYQQIAAILEEQQNFNLQGYKALCIKRRLAIRIRAAGHNDPEAYVKLLRASEEEQEQLLTTLSIHVSEFFRNPSVYAVLEKAVLPELLATLRQRGSKMRIWSIGCANGEEPYSLALLCQRHRQRGDAISIVATDLSSVALTRAKQGLFPRDRVRSVPGELLSQFFSHTGNQYQLCDEIRELVQFFQHDILIEQPLYRANLILCRNLLIYFSRSQQQKILQQLATALLPGGYLVLGRAETLVSACRDLFVCINPAERIYQRLV